MSKFTKTMLMEYIGKYDETKYLYEVIGPIIRERKYIAYPEFIKICTWKTSRQKKNYQKNSIEEVENITREAFLKIDEAQRMEKLCKLHGVRPPVASAMLSVYDPEQYPIIDIRCIEMLNLAGFVISKNVSVNVWIKYLQIMRDQAKKYGITPREMDMALYAMSVEKLEKENFSNLYGTRVKNY